MSTLKSYDIVVVIKDLGDDIGFDVEHLHGSDLTDQEIYDFFIARDGFHNIVEIIR